MNTLENMVLSILILTVTTLFLLMVFGENGYADLRLLRLDHIEIIKKKEKIIWKNLTLGRDVKRLKSNLDFIDSVVRRELGVVSPNEIVLTIMNPTDQNKTSEAGK